MSFWWVNHKQTYRQEISGGYIWSPKMDKNGARNQAYINLTLTEPNDTIFSYADRNITAVGRVVQECRDRQRPSEFGEIGEQWDKEGWLVRVDWIILKTPLNPKAHISEIAPLLPKKYSPIRSNGNGNQKCYLAAISESLGQRLLSLIKIDNNGLR